MCIIIYFYICILYVYIGVYHQPIPFPFFVAIIQFWPNSYGCTLMTNLLRVICLWGNLLRTVGTAPWQAIYVRAQGTDLEKAQPIYSSQFSNYLFIYWQTWELVRWTVYISLIFCCGWCLKFSLNSSSLWGLRCLVCSLHLSMLHFLYHGWQCRAELRILVCPKRVTNILQEVF